MTDPLPFLVALYARYSTDRQDARSIDDQLRRCREWAAARGYRVVEVYSDAAKSGAHREREDLQRMLRDAARKGGAPFKAVLVDDLSRLSRDLGDTWKIVFEDLASAGVSVIDVTTGMASDGAGARLTFGALALVNDTFLQLVRAETHRGLTGRALGGFWTGGRVYGYRTVEEENPPDPEHVRRKPVIDEEEAKVVLRIFRLFADGMALKKIAALLNAEGIEAPHDHGKGNKIGRGWPHSTVRAMLRNERYIGRSTWNSSKWIRLPGRKARRRVRRPESERIVRECPELAIVPQELWARVQDRFRRTNTPGRRSRPPGTGRHVYIVSGLLRCGVCQGSMTVVGRKIKAGVRYATFGCTTHAQRGSSVCPNARTVSEKKATGLIIEVLDDFLSDPTVSEQWRSIFETRLAERSRGQGATMGDLAHQVREAEKRVRNVTEAISKIGYSEALAGQLRAEEARLASLKAERARQAPSAARIAPPEPARIQKYARDMVETLKVDPSRGRETIGRHFTPVLMTPEGEGPSRSYRATGAFNLSSLLAEASGKSGSGGRI